MITSSTASRIASVMARKSSTSNEGVPSGRRAWMWICEAPSSTARRASAAYSSGVYGIAGHWSRFAIAPEIEHEMITGSSKRLTLSPPQLPPRLRRARVPPRLRRAGAPLLAFASYRHHPVLLPGPLDALAARHAQAADDRRAGLARVDDVVDERVSGRDVGVDGLADLGQHALARGLRVVGGLDQGAADDVDRALRPHDRDLGRRPGDDQVGLVGLAAHDVVAGAVGLADDDGDLRHGGARDRVEHLGPVADDPGVLDLRADHEARHVLEEDERDVEGVAEVDEAGRLVGRVVLEDASELLGLIGDDPDRLAAEAGEAGDDRLRELRLDVEELAAVRDLADHVVHVVRVPRGLRDDVEQLLRHAVLRIVRLADRRALLAVRREVGEVVLDHLDALVVVGHLE